MSSEHNKEVVLVLDNIRSVLNVGAIFRTADAVGVSKVYLTGVTPTPIDRFGRDRKDLAKTALGAEKNIAWEYVPTMEECIAQLKKEGYFLIAVEQDKTSVDYKEVKVKFPCAFVLGNEVNGLSKEVLKMVAVVAEIKMLGKKESLNVSVATGIVLFRVLEI